MHVGPRRWLAAPALALLLAACSSGPAVAPAPAAVPAVPAVAPPEVRAALAPAGVLRVGVYPGSPTSLVRPASPDEMRGVSVEIGRELARRLAVPAEIVVFQRVAEVVEAVKAGRVDFTITNATPARARDVDFSAPLLGLELGILVMPGSPVSSLDAVDRAGVRVGVSQGSTSQGTLGALYKQASLVPAPSLQVAAQMLRDGKIDAFATNKGILFEMADGLPGARVLDGRWGLESLAIALPKGRDVAKDWIGRFVAELSAQGQVQRAAERAGLRGTVPRP